ncbi:MAG: hypothetical protein IK144_08205 [Bacteroidaceae bacterium]|nr:hypothetical protein [Bacteroidaceae bacterium]
MKYKLFLFNFLLLILLTSCYKLISTFAPSEVEPGQTFEVSFTVVDDGSETQNFVTDWSYAGVRVPKGWTVTVPDGAHQQFAEDWVYYSDGSKVNSSHNMEPCDKLTQFYNAACPKSNYTWAGFKSVKKIPKNISACWRNGCDSIRVTFLVTVPEDAKPGRYQIDFMGGDEEDDAGIDKYGSYTDAKDSRLFHVSTASGSYVDNRNASLARTVIVTDATRITEIENEKSENKNRGAYDLQGRKIPTDALHPGTSGRGARIIIRNGNKIIRK